MVKPTCPAACPARITTPIAGKSTRPYDLASGAVARLASLGYQFQPDSQHKFNILGFYTQTLRSGFRARQTHHPLARVTTGCAVLSPLQPELYDPAPYAHEVGAGLTM
ncbi:hypothetical protein LNP74_33510 [Klebsiella pneumoniae subsp. pneumoniae]|nr:hypothetical protein [Klebsiella pneumoniae subsp. pneumoniae]